MKNQRILQDFERRLEGAVEGFFARAFRSGLQPIELAKGIRRYAEDQRQVGTDGMVVPNAFRFRVNPKDGERLAGYGDNLLAELGTMLRDCARDEGWTLAGPPAIELTTDEQVPYGIFRLTGKVDAGATPTAAPAQPPAPAATAQAPGPEPTQEPQDQLPADATMIADDLGEEPTPAPAAPVDAGTGLAIRLPDGTEVLLEGKRLVAGRLADNPITIDHTTVSRAHAAFVRRGDEWWVLDLGSTNGTRVNGRPAAEHPIGIGDEVELGEVLVEVVGR